MQYHQVIKKLELLYDPDAVSGKTSYGISTKSKTYGIRIPELRKLAKEIGKDHHLALNLWDSDIHEAKILASMVDVPKLATQEQMDKWVEDFDNWEICDQCCMNLFEKTQFAYKKCFDWSAREEEFIKRAGYVLIARLAVSDKKAPDENFEQFFPVIKDGADDNRNFVKKAVNWALRQIGKRNLSLNARAIEIAEEIQEMDFKSAKWIASDALRELTSQAVQKRLKHE